MKKSDLKKYAKLIVRVGANVKKGQEVWIYSNVSDEYFTKYVVEEAYKAKASRVRVEWQSDVLSELAYKYVPVKTLSKYEDFQLAKLQYMVDTLPCRIYIESSDPDALKNINQEKMMEVQKTVGPIVMKYREQIENKHQWCIVAIPGEAWAQKVFPECSKKKAVDNLWDAIFKCARVNGDPIENWDIHNKNIHEHCDKINEMKFKSFKYKSANGTDFEVGFKKGTHFAGAMETTIDGKTFNPNMPTEECFTSPDKYSANGVVYATKPLSVYGNLVSDFGFKFKDGKVVEVIAENKDYKALLEQLIGLDEGASHLGEVALVPFNSPVNETGLLFYNTLFDENACCHLALGRSFNDVIDDYEHKTPEEINALDLNQSQIHVDFMIGSKDLEIKGTTFDGKEIVVFKDGVWAF